MSTAILPDEIPVNSGHPTEMKIAKILELIDGRLKVVKLSDNAASHKAGRPEAIRNMRRTVKRGHGSEPTVRILADLAKVLEIPLSDLLRAGGIESPDRDASENGDTAPQQRRTLAAESLTDADLLREQRDRLLREANALDRAISAVEAEEAPRRPKARKRSRS